MAAFIIPLASNIRVKTENMFAGAKSWKRFLNQQLLARPNISICRIQNID